MKFLDAYYASGKDLAGYEYVKSTSKYNVHIIIFTQT